MSFPVRLSHLSLISLSFLLASVSSAEIPDRTWNPWGKESPEPYGYDVYTAPEIPLGYVDPEDPPATLGAVIPFDPLTSVLSVETSVDRTAYSWYGTVAVTAEVLRDGLPASDCDSVVVVSAANPRVRAFLADDGIVPDLVAGDGSYSGVFEVGAGEGESRPTGSYTVTAIAYRGVENGSGTSSSFSLYSVRRWTGITTSAPPDVSDYYTEFFVTSNGPGSGYHHRITDLGLIRSSAVDDAQIRIPILPTVNSISGVTVSGNGVSNVSVEGNVIAFDCDLTSGSVARVDIEFDAPSDLATTRIDRYQTGDIGLRNFRNGYLVWNRLIHTGILGSGFSYPHGPGCIVDLHVTDLQNGSPHTVDCMERVAVHLDNSAVNDGTGTYPSNIKWTGDALSWLESGSLGSLVFRNLSGDYYGLEDEVSVERRVEFFGESRYFHHRYVIENIDNVSHDFDFVWGREQWLYGSSGGSNRQTGDRGMLPNDPSTYGGEYGFGAAQLDGNWFVAFDLSSYYSIGVLLPENTSGALPTFSYFLCNPALGNFTGEYPINPGGSCSDMPNIFFEKQLGVLAPGESATYEFYQWGGYGQNRDDLTGILWEDADEVMEDPVAVGDLTESYSQPTLSVWPNPLTTSSEVSFDLPRSGPALLSVYDPQGRLVDTLIDGNLSTGRHAVVWRGRHGAGFDLPAGLYLLRLHTAVGDEALKVIIQR